MPRGFALTFWITACQENGLFQKGTFTKVPKKDTEEYQVIYKRFKELYEEYKTNNI
jgi:hypothetical protein